MVVEMESAEMEAGEARCELDVFVGSRIGSFKHIKYHTDAAKNSKKCIENLQDIRTLQKEDTITCMRWSDAEQTEILVGRASRQVQVYGTVEGAFVSSVVADYGAGHVVGLGRLKRRLVTALSGGLVRVWSRKKVRELTLDTGGPLDCMRGCPEDPALIVTGGKENELKVWRLGEPAPVFAAKNVPHDFLELREPVWPTSVCFLPGRGGALVAACSRYATVRLYDTRAQRRPVCNIDFKNMAAVCISPSFDERQVLVGFGRGQLHQVDLRGKGRPDKGYKGCAGAVTDVAAVPGTPYVISASLDRHVRVHHKVTKQMLYKQYVTSKLSCLLVQTATSTPLRRPAGEVKTEDEEEAEGAAAPARGDEDDLDEIFDNLESISEKQKVKRKAEQRVAGRKKLKQRPEPISVDCEVVEDDEVLEDEEVVEGGELVEGGEPADDEENVDDRIARLLRLTERKKKRMAKLKREKKAKSLYHNA